MQDQKQIWTIGHSTHPLQEFLEWLAAHHIKTLVDIRRYPGSRRYPHFKKEAMQESLPNHGFTYHHFEKLGGRRKARPDSVNKVWRHPSFRGYADYMETRDFVETAAELEQLALKGRTVIMCSEAVWWSCHRAMLSDYLKSCDWQVHHIMGPAKTTEHPYTKPARIVGGKLVYTEA